MSLLPPDNLPSTRSWFLQIPGIDKGIHFSFYFALISAVRLAAPYRQSYRPSRRWMLLIFAAAYGGVIEWLQGSYFGQRCEIWDEAANVAGAAAALWLIPQSWFDRTAQWFGRK
ncbi:MAG: VanZ family protein [Rikenellaceae bacterium]|nr:VanZ family protein [Rikenellaceae bacterium]